MRLSVARAVGVLGRSFGRWPLVLLALLVASFVFVAALRLEGVNRAAVERARSDAFYGRLYGFEASGPIPTSLAEVGRYTQAVVLGRFDGRVEPGRVVGSSSLGPLYDTYFANIGFRIEAILAGSLPAEDSSALLLEYLIGGPDEIPTLKATLPTERTVMFVGSKYLRRGGIETVYYESGVGRGTFRELDGRTVPVALPSDPQFGRLEGLPFDAFLDLVRRVPILDEMPPA